MTEPSEKDEPTGAKLTRQAAFFLVGALLLGLVAVLPFALADVVEDIAQSANPTYEIMADYRDEGGTHSHVNLALTSLDEWQRMVTIAVSGNHVCATPCDWTDRFVLVALPVQSEDGEGLPPYASVSFGPDDKAVSQQVKLPVSGDAIRYPFDRYGLRLAVVMQRVFPDGHSQTLSDQEARGHLFLSVNGSIPRAVLNKPTPVDVRSVFVDDPAYTYASVTQLTIVRPLYLRLFTVVLVLLISAAATYAVFMRPLHELVINSGALILGVWGIRAVLLGANLPGFTAVDLSLMIVILFLLASITWRALRFLQPHSGIPLRRHKGRRAAGGSDADQS